MTDEFRKNIVLYIAVLAIVVLGIFYFRSDYDSGEKESIDEEGINSFEDCIAAGNPVMESFPRQCRTRDGEHFVEEIDDSRDARLEGTGVLEVPSLN